MKSEMTGEQIRSQLGHLPAGQIRVPAVVECVVVADGFGQGLEQMRRLHERVDVAVRVAVEDDAAFGGDSCPCRRRARTTLAPCTPCTCPCRSPT